LEDLVAFGDLELGFADPLLPDGLPRFEASIDVIAILFLAIKWRRYYISRRQYVLVNVSRACQLVTKSDLLFRRHLGYFLSGESAKYFFT